MADYDCLLRMQGTAHRYLEKLGQRFAHLSAPELAAESRKNLDLRGLVEDYLRFNCSEEFRSSYSEVLSKIESLASARSQPSGRGVIQKSAGELIEESGRYNALKERTLNLKSAQSQVPYTDKRTGARVIPHEFEGG